MIKRWALCGTVLWLAFLPAGRADQITTVDNRSFNGWIKTMGNGIIVVDARFPDGSRTLSVPLDKLKRVEFNAMAVNTGSAPQALAVRPKQEAKQQPSPGPQAPTPSQQAQVDSIYLFGNSQRNCMVTAIDAGFVICSEQKISRGQVKSIVFAPR